MDQPDPFPDIEWMLKRTQASVAVIAEALLAEYGPRLAQVAFALVMEASAARLVTEDGLALAIARAPLEWDGLNLETWLVGHVVRAAVRQLSRQPAIPLALLRRLQNGPVFPGLEAEIQLWQALSSLKTRDRLPLTLVAGLGYPCHLAACWLKGSERSIRARAGAAAAAITSRLDPVGFHLCQILAGPDSPAPDLETALRAIFARQAYLAEIPAGEWPAAARRIQSRIERQEQLVRESLLRRQVAVGIFALLLVLAVLRWTNKLLPASSSPRPTPAQRVQRAGSQLPLRVLPPLTENPTPPQVLNRMYISQTLWRSLWADARIMYYGPPGYFGPPQVYRNQVWLRAHGPGLYLTGPDADNPDAVFSSSQDKFSGLDLQSGRFYSDRSAFEQAVSPIFQLADLDLDANQNLKGFFLTNLIFPDWDRFAIGQFSVTGSETLAGRAAVQIKWVPKTGAGSVFASIDALTGLILRWRQYYPGRPDLLSFEILITSLDPDPLIPESVFNLQQVRGEALAWGSIWEPEGQSGRAAASIPAAGDQSRAQPGYIAPPYFDPSGSSLTFSWPRDSGQPGAAASPTDLFAGAYYLGQVDLGNPWTLACTRSPDGNLIAYTSTKEGTPLRWIRLANPDRVHTVDPQGSFGQFAFSPDSRSLAFQGCQGVLSCGVFILDMGSGETRRLAVVPLPASLVWSPNGKLLGIVTPDSDPRRLPNLSVVDARSGVFLYQAPFQPDRPEKMTYAPLDFWGIDYPPHLTGIAACARPPAGS